MLNSYEIAKKLEKKIHLPINYKLSVIYNPWQCAYGFYISKDEREVRALTTSSNAIDTRIEKYGIEYEADTLEDELLMMIEEITLDELVEYYYKKGKKMSEINNKLVKWGKYRW